MKVRYPTRYTYSVVKHLDLFVRKRSIVLRFSVLFTHAGRDTRLDMSCLCKNSLSTCSDSLVLKSPTKIILSEEVQLMFPAKVRAQGLSRSCQNRSFLKFPDNFDFSMRHLECLRQNFPSEHTVREIKNTLFLMSLQDTSTII